MIGVQLVALHKLCGWGVLRPHVGRGCSMLSGDFVGKDGGNALLLTLSEDVARGENVLLAS